MTPEIDRLHMVFMKGYSMGQSIGSVDNLTSRTVYRAEKKARRTYTPKEMLAYKAGYMQGIAARVLRDL